MLKSIATTLCSLVFVSVSLGCSATPVHWQKESWAKQDADEAHSLCAKRARVATGADVEQNQWSEYMKECMATRGYTLVRGRDPGVKNEPTRKTASEMAVPNT